ncbi:hypothetical protein NBRC116590_03090 [Pelagimonas sp. KU-00592-HH]|uniref:recombinase RecT n=1 Tax=Pelagimonas sp. KU-00592-HH TaxID=3127651 RepID=UPI0031055CE8
MNTATNVSVAKEVEGLSVFDPNLGSYGFSNLGEVVQFADLMAAAGPMLPKHCQGKAAICLAITMRATHWGFDPFALAQESFQTKTDAPIAYSAKVFVAALKNCTGIELQYRYEGEIKMLDKPALSRNEREVAKRTAVGDRRCIAFIEVDGVVKEYQSPTLDEITIKNSALWHNDPDQQLAYYAGRAWTRRYEPGVIMGAFSTDEVESMTPMRDITPSSKGGFAATAEAARHPESAKTIEHKDEQSGDAKDPKGDGSDAAAAEVENNQEQPKEDLQPHWTQAVDYSGGFPGSDEFTEGAKAAQNGTLSSECPHEGDIDKAADWLAGWHQSNEAAKQ